jgi:hypothetical protein
LADFGFPHDFGDTGAEFGEWYSFGHNELYNIYNLGKL